MKISNLLAALLLSLATVSPVLAADEPLDKVVDGSLLVTRVGGVGSGVIIGTPVAVVRESVTTYIHMTGAAADKVGGKDCGPCCLLVSLVTAPVSLLVVGPAKGLYFGCKNGIMDGFTAPFSPASFSMTKEMESK